MAPRHWFSPCRRLRVRGFLQAFGLAESPLTQFQSDRPREEQPASEYRICRSGKNVADQPFGASSSPFGVAMPEPGVFASSFNGIARRLVTDAATDQPAFEIAVCVAGRRVRSDGRDQSAPMGHWHIVNSLGTTRGRTTAHGDPQAVVCGHLCRNPLDKHDEP